MSGFQLDAALRSGRLPTVGRYRQVRWGTQAGIVSIRAGTTRWSQHGSVGPGLPPPPLAAWLGRLVGLAGSVAVLPCFSPVVSTGPRRPPAARRSGARRSSLPCESAPGGAGRRAIVESRVGALPIPNRSRQTRVSAGRTQFSSTPSFSSAGASWLQAWSSSRSATTHTAR